MSALVCPIIVGRDTELAGLSRVLRDALEGRGAASFVLGEAGIGKSRVVAETAARAGDLGMRVLQGRAVETGAQVPFRPFAEAFQSAFRSADVLPAELAPFRLAIGKILPQWSRDDRIFEANPILVFEAIVRLLRLLGEPGGMLLILEDLHWADAETLSALDYVVDHIGESQVACVCTTRNDEPIDAVRIIGRIAARHPTSRFELARLDGSFVEEMTTATLGAVATAPEVAAAVAERSEGVPLLVEELLSAYSEAARAVPAPDRVDLHDVPSSYAVVVEQRLARLGRHDREIVLAAAAVGSEVRPELLSAITGFNEGGVLDGLRAAVRASLLVERTENGRSSLVFRHALVGDAVLASLLPNERRDLYQRAARAIKNLFPGLPDEWCNRVAELYSKAGDLQSAADHLIEAGRRALKRGALLTAEHTLERARSLVEGDRWKTTGVDRVLVRVLSLLGNTDRLRELGDSALAFMKGVPDLLGTPERQGEILLQIARGMASARDWESVHVRMQPVVALAERSSAEEFRARARSFGARVALERGELDAADDASEEVLADAAFAGVVDAVCEAQQVRAGVALARHDSERAVKLLHEAKLYAERRDLTLWRVEILLDLAAMDEAQTGSLANIVAAGELVAMTEAPLTQARVDLQTARTRLARFELDLAEEALRAAIELCRRYRLPSLRETLAVKAQAGALRGDATLVRAWVKEAEGLPVTSADEIGFYEAKVILKIGRGDLGGAREELARAVPVIARDRREHRRWLAGLWILLATLDGDYVDPPGWVSPADPLVRHARAIRLGEDGDSTPAVVTFESADDDLAPFPWRRNLARRLVAEAAIRDSWGDPASFLGAAAAFFDSTGQAGLASACRGLLRRAGVAVPRRGRGRAVVPESLRSVGITSREMDVLDLLREGLSNNEIARRLYISVRTVESHVTSSMRKTGAASRPQLIAWLLEDHVGPIEPRLG